MKMNITSSTFIYLSVGHEEAGTDGRTTWARIWSRSIQKSGLKLANCSNWHRLAQQSESGSELDTTHAQHYFHLYCRYFLKQSAWQMLVQNRKKKNKKNGWMKVWGAPLGCQWNLCVWHTTVRPEMKNLSSFIHHHVMSNLYGFLSSSEHNKRFEECR